MPPKDEYTALLYGIWERVWLTNDGPLVHELENRLKSKLDVQELQFVANGTLGLQIGLKALEITGEVITTPFSYVATSSVLCWRELTPVFVDIDPGSFNIDPYLIEEKITEKTSAILATHVFSNPCDIDRIYAVAKKYNLKVIFDAAHCFASKYKGESVLNFGDVSMISFHATKLFHTVEGGAVVCGSAELAKKMRYQANFGHAGPEAYRNVGINGKNSEFHAAMGLTNLKYVDKILAKRKRDYEYYQSQLSDCSVRFQRINPNGESNYSYVPILFKTELDLLKAKDELEKNDIYPRRYFYPGLHRLPYVKPIKLSVMEDISSRILCLPQFYELTQEQIDLVVKTIRSVIN